MKAGRLVTSALLSVPAMPVLTSTTIVHASKSGLTTPDQPGHVTTVLAQTDEKPKSSVTVLSEYCKGCELCVHACPTGNLSLSEHLNRKGYHPAVFRYEGTNGPCSACGICYWVCPDMAISKVGKLGH